MSYLTAVIIMLVILVVIAVIFWGIPMLKREKPSKGGSLVVAPPPPPGSAGGYGPYGPGTSKMAFIAATASLPLDQDFGPQSTAAATRSAGGFAGGRAEHHGTGSNHLDASPSLEWYDWHDRQDSREGLTGRREHHGTGSNHLDASPSLEWYGWHDRFRKEGHGGWRHHLDASPSLEWYGPGGQLESPPAPIHASVEGFSGSRKERYGEPPGMIRAVHQDELGFRGWADMPGDYEGSSASAISAYMQRSA
jgi:hypothetical protein